MTKRIGIISDTHGFWDEAFERYFSSCDEIWHAGDIGNLEVTDKLNKIAPLKAVYGNIDNNEIRHEFPEDLYFKMNNQKIMITHIAGKICYLFVLLSLVIMFVEFKNGLSNLNENTSIVYSYSMYLLVASLPLIFLANRAIKKDDELVKSVDRLR